MLFDPFEEEFHLPAGLVDAGDGKSRKGKVVCQEFEPPAGFHIEVTDATQGVRIYLRGTDSSQDDRVIGSHAGGLVHSAGISAFENNVGFCSHDEERATEP